MVIGSSAGGIDALGALVETLPKDFGAPIIIAQHLDPRRESHLADILGRRTSLPIKSVADNEWLRPGVIFVVPADRNVVIRDEAVAVETDGTERGSRPSIDRAFISAADAYGEGMVAVILTGAGSDGAAGARHVKAAGGTVVIQNPETASYPAMPLSLAPTTVDIVAELEAIGPLLQDLVTGAYPTARPDDDRMLSAFLDEVREATGIDFGQYKRPTIVRRLHRRMVATGSETLRDYIRHVQGNPDELRRLTNSFLIKVTEFFRDADLYRHLQQRVLPELVEYGGQHGGELRFWSAGCATGEEAYSLAIVAAEATRTSDVRVRIFATDIDEEAIEFARRGIYAPAAVERLPAELVTRYFLHSDGQFEVAPSLRRMLAFGQHDLAQRAPFPRIDLTVCRNVLIYFTPELQRRALQLFAFALRDDGYLVLGKAETTSPLADHFVLENARLKVFRRRGPRVVLPTARGAPPHEIHPTLRAPVDGRARLADARRGRVAADLERAQSQAARADRLVMRLPVGIALIDRRYDIALINSSARNLLGVHGAAVGQDLVHLVHGIPSTELRRDIDQAFRGEPVRSVWDIPVAESTSGETMSLEVSCFRQGDGAPEDELVTLVVRDVTRERTELSALRETSEREHRRADGLVQQIRLMSEAAAHLREANEELTSVNAELRTQNEELLVSNEEVQAATEEVETLNEEMQATNEELETLNEELQATVEELNTTNDDLESRTTELQSLATSLEQQRAVSEAERARLAGVLSSMADAVVVVDKVGEPTLTNEAFDRTIGAGDDLVLEDDAGQAIAEQELPWRRAARGEAFSLSFSTTDADGERRWFEARGRPLDPKGVAGAVVVVRDVTDRSLQQLQSEFVAMVSHELRTPLTGVSAYLELLERELRDEPGSAAHRYADRALTQVQRFTSLVSELFDANRLRSGRMRFDFRPVELRGVVEEAIAICEPLAAERPIVLHASEALRVRADSGRLQQVALNLIGNAITHASGSPRIEVHLRRRDGQAEVAVRDFGPGVPPHLVDELFATTPAHPPVTAPSREGLGLGLYIARAIVEAHGGTISVDSAEGEGATFTVRLPLLEQRSGKDGKAKSG